MKQKSSNIIFLLSILGLLSMSIGHMHTGKNAQGISKMVPHLLIDAIEDLSAKEVRRMIDPLIFAHSIYSAGQVLAPVKLSVLQDLFHSLFTSANPMNRNEKILLLILAAQYQPSQKERFALYDMLLQYPTLEVNAGQPVLAIAAKIESPYVLKSMIAWLAYHKKTGDYAQLRNWVASALRSLVQDGDFNAFKRLFEQPLKINLNFASQLLVRAIQQNKDLRFISFLISKGVNPNYVGPHNRTLLMEAVLKNNEKMVEELLNLGADPNYFADPAVGSAIQLAYERGYVDLELLMRRYAEEKIKKSKS